ncbi:MAG TPA: DUF1501 domain-containing protein [Pirellulales bacterium]|nr:DUF1501 domain-containing protein [Pirellulales bacterium]
MSDFISRRTALERLGGGMAAVGLASMLSAKDAAAETALHFAPRAKRVIHLFMNGGPFAGDFFDPKPAVNQFAGQRPAEVELRTERQTAGLMGVPFRYERCGQSGLEVSELLPRLAGAIDDLCVLRSVYTDNPNHGPALFLMNNGTITPTRPSMGSWLSYGLGTENDDLPGYVVLCPGRPVRFAELWASAFLPGEHQGTYINHSDLDPRTMVPFLRNPSLDATAQRRQLDLLRRLDQEHLAERGPDRALEARIKSMETAFRMQFAATDAFDLTLEPQWLREEYGNGHFAHACLLARRLAERGVRFTQIYYGDGQPWDTHTNHDALVRDLAADIDRPIAALLKDLKQRGLFDETLVVWGGEFGRTPTSENGNGRDHNHYGFTMWMAGGGVRGGMAHGATDDFGFRAVTDRVHIHDLHATILHLLGLDHERLTYRYAGRDFRLTDVHGRVVREILA